MSYAKKILVLNQTAEGFSVADKRVSAIVRIEKDGGIFTLYLSAVNFAAADGNFHLAVCSRDKSLFTFPLGNRPASLTKEADFPEGVTEGFAAGIVFAKNDLPTLVAFSDCEACKIEKADFKKLLINKFLHHLKQESDKASLPPAFTDDAILRAYDDEAVATENYYLLDEKIKEKLDYIERTENAGLKTSLRDSESKEGTQKNEPNDNGDKTEERLAKPETTDYYQTAKPKLESIFFKFPEEKTLSSIIPESRWAKVNYAGDKYYVVGVIKKDGKERYVCYGVPAKYSATPPKELKGYCSFVPSSFFDMKGDGYWMMFQSAITGECVKPKA